MTAAMSAKNCAVLFFCLHKIFRLYRFRYARIKLKHYTTGGEYGIIEKSMCMNQIKNRKDKKR